MWTRLLTDSCLLPPSRILPLFLVDNLFFLSDFRYCLAFPKAIVPMSSVKLQYLLTMLNFFFKVCELGGGTVLYHCVGLFCIFVVIEVKITLLAISVFCEVPRLHNMLSFSLSFYFPPPFFFFFAVLGTEPTSLYEQLCYFPGFLFSVV